MPSPFPGMDPYLESPDWFPNLQGALITFTVGSLMHRLPEPYYARSRQRVWLEATRRFVEPDADLMPSSRGHSLRRTDGGGAAIAEPEVAYEQATVDEPVAVTVERIEHDPYHEPFVEVRRRYGAEDRLVAVIEVLSPANKTPENPGRASYREKQNEVLAGPTHLIEIDVLRGGSPATAVPHDLAVARAGPFDYHVCVRRFERPDVFFVYPIRLEHRLPVVAIPLLPGEPDVRLPLQEVLDRAYDQGPYSRVIFYGEDPIIPPLEPEKLDWVKARLEATR